MKKIKFLFLFFLILSACSQASPLPVLGQLSEFKMINEKGREVHLKDYRNKIWIANFIFTSCAGTCPLLTQRMKAVQDELEAKKLPVHIVSFSVDPERDTPERLASYAQSYGADATRWCFLTGPLEDVTRVVVQGFKISMGKVKRDAPVEAPSEGEIFDIVHGEKFILVDAQGQIRGYYDSDSTGIRKIFLDLKKLLKE